MPRGGVRPNAGRKLTPGRKQASKAMAGMDVETGVVKETLLVPPEFDGLLPLALAKYKQALRDPEGFRWLKPLNELFGYFHPRLSASASVKKTTSVKADVQALMVKLLGPGDTNPALAGTESRVLDVLVTTSDPAEGADEYLQPPADPAPDTRADWDVGADD